MDGKIESQFVFRIEGQEGANAGGVRLWRYDIDNLLQHEKRQWLRERGAGFKGLGLRVG